MIQPDCSRKLTRTITQHITILSGFGRIYFTFHPTKRKYVSYKFTQTLAVSVKKDTATLIRNDF